MKIMALGTLATALLFATPAIAKDIVPQFKSVEAKHFPRAEGVELSPAFSDYLYAELRAELTKAKLFGQVIGEDEVVDPRSEEHTSELQSHLNLVCRLLLEKKKKNKYVACLHTIQP